jgi:hypothetical protein
MTQTSSGFAKSGSQSSTLYRRATEGETDVVIADLALIAAGSSR